jgi:hypothetical protein
MFGRLNLAGDLANLVRRIEPGDPPGAALRGQDIPPARLHVAAERRYEPETCDDYAAHA